MGVYSIIVGTLAGIVIVGASFFVFSHQTQNPSERSRGSSFTVPSNVFDIFNRSNNTDTPTPADELTPAESTQPTQDDRDALNALARAWGQRRAALHAQYGTTNTTTAPTTESTQPQELFTTLLGPKLTDALKSNTSSRTSTSTSTSFNGEAALWGGTTDVAPAQPVQVVDSTYAIQKELHEYGNELGSALMTFIQTQGDQSALLSLYVGHRTDTVAQEKLKALTDAYAAFSQKIATIHAPTPLAQNHEHLVQGYAHIGQGLWDMTTAQTDGELYNKLIAYNTVAEDVARYHISVITVLKAYGVTFAPGEPGNAFVFDGAQGLSL